MVSILWCQYFAWYLCVCACTLVPIHWCPYFGAHTLVPLLCLVPMRGAHTLVLILWNPCFGAHILMPILLCPYFGAHALMLMLWCPCFLQQVYIVLKLYFYQLSFRPVIIDPRYYISAKYFFLYPNRYLQRYIYVLELFSTNK